MQKIIILLSILFVGCNYKLSPEGNINDIIVVCSNEDQLQAQPFIDELFYDPIHTPQEESIFNIKWIKPWEINKYKKYHNLLLVSLRFPVDSTGDYLMDKYLDASNTKEEIFIRENVYSNNQLIISMQAYDIIDLERIISQSSYWIKNNVNEKYNEKIINHIYSKGLNMNLMSYINQVYDLKFDIQKDFIILNEDENNQFIWLGRGYPYRWISIFKIKYNKTYSFWNSLEEKVDEFMPSISISEYYRKKDETYIKDNNKINVYRGIYDHQESETGGPFFVYEIKKTKNDEIIFLTGFVNYPGHKKINLLKGIEVLFNTVEI